VAALLPRIARADDVAPAEPDKPIVIPATPEPAPAPAKPPSAPAAVPGAETPRPVPPAPPPSPPPTAGTCPGSASAGCRPLGPIPLPTTPSRDPRPAGTQTQTRVEGESFAAIRAAYDARESATPAGSEARRAARLARYDAIT